MRTRGYRPVATMAVTILCAACGGDGDSGSRAAVPEDTTPAPAPEPAAYRVIEVPNGAVIRGSVRLTGSLPPLRTIAISDDAATCGTSRELTPVRRGPAGGLADAVVSLRDVTEGAPFPPDLAPTLDQQRCTFRPHIVLAPAGATVRVLNSDPVTHNVHTASFDNRPVNRTRAANMSALELTFTTPERVRVRCDLHKWMNAWIIVMAHPYHAVTSDAGTFALRNVPPGTYTLEIWHEELGSRTDTVTVAAGDTVNLTIEMTTGA